MDGATLADIRQNAQDIRLTLERESAPWGRAPLLIAVTKTVDADTALLLEQAGITAIAENRAQALMQKWPAVEGKFAVHMIGRLQTNKVKYIIDKVCLVHSLDRLSLAREISRLAQEKGIVMPVLAQVNVSGESAKAGIAPEAAEGFLRQCASLPGLAVRGLMTMLPLDAPDAQKLRWFTQTRALFDSLRETDIPNARMEELSMGMSRDYALAARAGATMVRIGTALFRRRV